MEVWARQELVKIYNWASCWNNQWSYLWHTTVYGVTIKLFVCVWSYQFVGLNELVLKQFGSTTREEDRL